MNGNKISDKSNMKMLTKAIFFKIISPSNTLKRLYKNLPKSYLFLKVFYHTFS